MVSMLLSSAVYRDWIGSHQKLLNWYLLLLCEACSIKEKEQRLVGSESEIGRASFSYIVVASFIGGGNQSTRLTNFIT
jgi:hypothetical protein